MLTGAWKHLVFWQDVSLTLVKFMWMYGLYAIVPLMIPYMGMLRKSCSAM